MISISSYSQNITLKCAVNGYFRLSDGNASKLDPSTITLTLENIKGVLVIDIDGNSDYSFGMTSSTFTTPDKFTRYEGMNLSDENKYFIKSKGYGLQSNRLESETSLSLNRISGTINYSTKLLHKENPMKFTITEVNGECIKISNAKRF